MPKRYGIDDAAKDILAKTKTVARTAGKAALDKAVSQLIGGYPAAMAVLGNPVSFLFGDENQPAGPYAAQPPPAPPGVSLEANLAEASRHPGDLLWWIDKVNHGHDWDYKKSKGPQYEDFGNYNYGATGGLIGLPPGVVARGSGAAQIWSDAFNPRQGIRPGTPIGAFPYGDEPADQPVIMDGYRRKR